MKALMCWSCDLPENTDGWYDTPSLSRLELDGYPFSIYKFFTWSMYNDSQFMGYTIVDTNQVFTLNGIKELDFDFLKELPTTDTLKVIKLVLAKDPLQVKKEPVRTNFNQRSGFTIQTEYLEKHNGYTSKKSNAQWFIFSSLKERSDSLIFYGVKSRYPTNLHQDSDSIVLPKWNLYHNIKGSNTLATISAEVLIEEKANLYIYKKGTNVLESTVKDSFVRIKRSYTFTPSDSTVNMDLSSVGMFQQIQ
jgi:hypothetical protein